MIKEAIWSSQIFKCSPYFLIQPIEKDINGYFSFPNKEFRNIQLTQLKNVKEVRLESNGMIICRFKISNDQSELTIPYFTGINLYPKRHLLFSSCILGLQPLDHQILSTAHLQYENILLFLNNIINIAYSTQILLDLGIREDDNYPEYYSSDDNYNYKDYNLKKKNNIVVSDKPIGSTRFYQYITGGTGNSRWNPNDPKGIDMAIYICLKT